jgi:large subunit ribosomal protein L13
LWKCGIAHKIPDSKFLVFFWWRITVPGTKSYNAQTDSLEKNWWLVDGENQVIGRIAADIAMVLMGKHRPNYTPHIDTGDFVIVTNCDKLKFSGSKADKKVYTWYTGHPGLRTETAGNRLQRKPEKVLTDAVRRMLPKNKLSYQMLSKLKVYRGSEHPHAAQNPQPLKGGRTLK